VQEVNSLLVDTGDADECFGAIESLIVDEALRQRLAQCGLATAARYSPERAAASELAVLRYGGRSPVRRDPVGREPVGRKPVGRELVGREIDGRISRARRPRGLELYRRRLVKLLREPRRFLLDSRFGALRGAAWAL